MYEAFYGCKSIPFARTIPSKDLYTPPLFGEISGRLMHAAARQLFVVFTGETGTGKTTTLRWFNPSSTVHS